MTKYEAGRPNPTESWRAFLAYLIDDKKRFRRLLGLIIVVALLLAGIATLILYLSSGNPAHDLGMLFMVWEQRHTLR